MVQNNGDFDYKQKKKKFGKGVNSLRFIPFVEDLENKYLVYFVLKEKGKMRM